MPGDSMTLTFRGTRLDLVTRRHDAAGRLLVVMDGHPVPGLPTDERGRSYVDLYSPTRDADARVTLVRDAVLGQHTVTVTVAEGRPRYRAVDRARSMRSRYPRGGRVPLLQTGLLAVALAGDGWLLWATRGACAGRCWAGARTAEIVDAPRGGMLYWNRQHTCVAPTPVTWLEEVTHVELARPRDAPHPVRPLRRHGSRSAAFVKKRCRPQRNLWAIGGALACWWL